MATSERFDRRRFIGIAGGAIAGTALAACGSSTSGNPTTTTGLHPTTTSTSAASTTTTTSGPVTSADWSSLARSLSEGAELLQPSASGYTTAAQLFDPTFDTIQPEAIAYCATAGDVVSCIKFVKDHDLPFAARSGGHSYGGYSSSAGLVVDVTRQQTIALDHSSETATIGSGACLIDIYNELGTNGFALPGGSCPTVGIAGLTLGGGLGVIDRQYGLTCDNLLEATVVLANGDIVTASDTENPDLFWALRGGGGGNFGVVTSFKFKVYPAGNLGLFTLVWEWDDAPRVIEAWQSWAPNNPASIWSNCQLLNSQSTPNGTAPAARVTGVSTGSVSALQTAVNTFVASVGVSPFNNFVGGDSYLNSMLVEAGCDGRTIPECHLPSQNSQGLISRSPFAAKSSWLETALPSGGITALVDAVDDRVSSGYPGGGIVLDSAGGAINQVAPDATAFVHRNALASLQYSAGWSVGDSETVVQANRNWLETAWTLMSPYMNGQAYQNYIDPYLANWQEAYYGSNLPRLMQVKKQYDPDNLFKFAQSIPV